MSTKITLLASIVNYRRMKTDVLTAVKIYWYVEKDKDFQLCAYFVRIYGQRMSKMFQ